LENIAEFRYEGGNIDSIPLSPGVSTLVQYCRESISASIYAIVICDFVMSLRLETCYVLM